MPSLGCPVDPKAGQDARDCSAQAQGLQPPSHRRVQMMGPALDAAVSQDITPDWDLSKRLKAAKPITWRGRGDLLQCNWAPPLHGTWVVVDLWSGIGGLLLALLSMGCHCYAISAENDPFAREAAKRAMPNLIHVDDVAQVRASDFQELLVKRKPRGILVGGGSPCQGNSSLNQDRLGLSDPRSNQPLHLKRILSEFRELPECEGIDVVGFLENVGSMPPDVRAQYNEWLGSAPMMIEAGWCGWTKRHRLYWLASLHRGLSQDLHPPRDWQWTLENAKQVTELRYKGSKPIPARVAWEDGYTPLFDSKEILAGQLELAMHTFTRAFWHPADRVPQVSHEAAQRFYEDARQFPPGAYEENSLVWKLDQWRSPSVTEKCQMMGLPLGAVQVSAGPSPQRRQMQHSFLGNGFHLPSVIAVLSFLPQLLSYKIPPPFADESELELKTRLVGLHSGPSLTGELRAMLNEFEVDEKVWDLTCLRLSACQLLQLQMYPAWCRLRGRDWQSLGPTPVPSRDRTFVFAGLTGQRYPSSSTKGLDHLIPPGLGKEGHLEESAKIPSPFHPRDWPEPDVQFVVEALFVWQVFMVRFAAELRHILACVARAVKPLEQVLDTHRCFSSQKVASDKRPAFIAVMTILLRWPDRCQANQLIQGYPIVGELPSSGLFRPVPPPVVGSMTDWLGDQAEQAIQTILTSRPPLHSDAIHAITIDEQERGFCGPWLTKLELDDQYGQGNWRPLERFLIQQPDGKQRCIDNARKTGHNRVTGLWETITTVSPDCVAAFGRMVSQQFALTLPPWETHSWMDMRIGTDDLPDAYRGLPVCDSHLAFSVVAVYVPTLGWRFTPLYGLAYGLESAVINFNRFPQLGVAIARRCCLSFSAAYFDDQLSVEFIKLAGVSQKGLQLCFTLMGAAPHPAKSFTAATNRHFLGTSIHTGDFCTTGCVRFQPKTLTRAKVLGRLDLAMETGVLDRDTAGKLRGDLNWMFSHCAGNIGKFAGPLLTELQHDPPQTLSPEHVQTLRILRNIVALASPRDIQVLGAPPPTLRIYSDASFEHGELRLGWVCFVPNCRPFGGSCLVPPTVLAHWLPRRQQIYPGEALCGLVVPWVHGDRLRDFDIVWYVDNEGACSSLIRGCSRQSDVHLISQFSGLLLHSINSRCWFEWVDTDSNCSDGLSRAGITDEWTQAQGWEVCDFPFPNDLLPDTFLQSFISHLGLLDSGCIV